MATPEFPTDTDVVALIRHQYPTEEFDEIVALLEPVNHEGHFGWTPARIRLAALAMSNGNQEQIPMWIEQGNKDCRDLQRSVHAALGATWDREILMQVFR